MGDFMLTPQHEQWTIETTPRHGCVQAQEIAGPEGTLCRYPGSD